jgi:hypothetical protein
MRCGGTTDLRAEEPYLVRSSILLLQRVLLQGNLILNIATPVSKSSSDGSLALFSASLHTPWSCTRRQ